jgi:hypothetical protein
MKKFTINCDFGGQMSPFAIFIGKPEQGHHPLHFQADWLSKARGGMIPGEVMEAVTQLQELAEKNGVSLEELCVYALGTDEQQAELESNATADSGESESESIEQEESEAEPERHEVDGHYEHDESESVEDMASEGGHIEEDTSEDISLAQDEQSDADESTEQK